MGEAARDESLSKNFADHVQTSGPWGRQHGIVCVLPANSFSESLLLTASDPPVCGADDDAHKVFVWAWSRLKPATLALRYSQESFK